jgi:hypothetical protein
MVLQASGLTLRKRTSWRCGHVALLRGQARQRLISGYPACLRDRVPV